MLTVRMTAEQRQNLFVFLARVDLKGREVSQFNELTDLFARAEQFGSELPPKAPAPHAEKKVAEENKDA